MPIVNLFYDGTGGQNRSMEVYLRTALNADNGHGAQAPGPWSQDPGPRVIRPTAV
jgi:hypothetical protein